jgi:hypothetical protein
MDARPNTNISKYELDSKQPPLAVLGAYARIAAISVEALIDDEITFELGGLAPRRAW